MSKRKYKLEGTLSGAANTRITDSTTRAQLSEPVLERADRSSWYSIEWVTEESHASKILKILETIYKEALSGELGSLGVNCFSRLTLEELFFIFEESSRVKLVTTFITTYTSRKQDIFLMLESLSDLRKFFQVERVDVAEQPKQIEQSLRAKIHKELDF